MQYTKRMGKDWLERSVPGLREAARAMGKILIRPSVIALLVLALTYNYWGIFAAYCLLKTCLFGAGPALIWVVVVAAALGLVGGLGYFVFRTLRLAPIARAASKAGKAGDMDARKGLLEAYRAQFDEIGFWPIWVSMLSLLAAVPSMMALVLSFGTPALVRDHGKLRYATHDEEIRLVLHRMERRDIFSPTNRD